MEPSSFYIIELVREIGVTKALSIIIVLSCHFFIFLIYNGRIKDKQDEIDRLVEDNREYKDRFLKILDKQFNYKNSEF